MNFMTTFLGNASSSCLDAASSFSGVLERHCSGFLSSLSYFSPDQSGGAEPAGRQIRWRDSSHRDLGRDKMDNSPWVGLPPPRAAKTHTYALFPDRVSDDSVCLPRLDVVFLRALRSGTLVAEAAKQRRSGSQSHGDGTGLSAVSLHRSSRDKSNENLINNSAELSENWAAVTISELLGTEVTRELEGVFLRENVNCAEQQQQQQKDDNNIKILHDAVYLRKF
ncbi:hypothetical protein EYF80_048655 [Liparis tanakae]|uniref:Uncharacterized protein n=1 Tax=Liparis tanakae TaxID=230148 RepID=A0A4Z2FIY3_9TELE|nr:hypothetical protein EYF80_048655 [Liparis tanakae]